MRTAKKNRQKCHRTILVVGAYGEGTQTKLKFSLDYESKYYHFGPAFRKIPGWMIRLYLILKDSILQYTVPTIWFVGVPEKSEKIGVEAIKLFAAQIFYIW